MRVSGEPNGSNGPFLDLLQLLRADVLPWIATEKTASSAHVIALERLAELRNCKRTPSIVLTSVTRVVEQKVFLLRAPGNKGVSGLKGVLDVIGDTGIYILLGAGDSPYEDFLVKASATIPGLFS